MVSLRGWLACLDGLHECSLSVMNFGELLAGSSVFLSGRLFLLRVALWATMNCRFADKKTFRSFGGIGNERTRLMV